MARRPRHRRRSKSRAQLINRNSAGFDASFNQTFPAIGANRHGGVAPWRLGLNEGPIVLMIENHATGLLWNIARRCSYVVDVLKRASFHSGWLAT